MEQQTNHKYFLLGTIKRALNSLFFRRLRLTNCLNGIAKVQQKRLKGLHKGTTKEQQSAYLHLIYYARVYKKKEGRIYSYKSFTVLIRGERVQ